MIENHEPLLTVREVAEQLLCAEETVRRLVRRGELTATRAGARLRFRRADVDAFRAARGRRSLAPDLTIPFRDLFENAPDAIFVEAPDGTVLAVNPAACRLHGCTAADLIGRNVLDLVPPDQRAAVRDGFSRLFVDGLDPIEGYSQTIDGRRVPVELRAQQITYAGAPAMLLHVRDITERKRAEAQARDLTRAQDAQAMAEAAQQRMAVLADASTLLVTTLDYAATLSQVVWLMVPQFADYCTIHLISEHGVFELVEVAHINPVKAELVREMHRRYPPDIRPPDQFEAMAMRGAPLLVADVPPSLLADMAYDAEHLAQLQELAPVSSIVLPLCSRNRVLGVMTWNTAESGRHYTADDLALAEELARRATLAIENAQLYEVAQAERRRAEGAAERTARLHQVAAALAEARTPAEVAGVIVHEGVAAFSADAGSIFALVEDGLIFELMAYEGYDEAMSPQYVRLSAAGFSPLRDAARTRTAVMVESPAEMIARWPHLSEAQAQSGDAATVAVPLLVEERVLGVLYLAFRAPRSFSADDQAFVTTLARQCAQAFDRARLYEAEYSARERAEQAAERTARLQALTAAFAEALTPTHVAEVLLNQGMDALSISGGGVGLLTRDGAMIDLMCTRGYPPDLVEQFRHIPITTPAPYAEAIRYGEPIWLESGAALLERYPALAGAHRELGDGAAASVPLIVNRRVIGGLSLQFAEPRTFSPEDRSYILAVAQQCTQALERARLYADSQAQAARLAVLADASQAFAAVSLDLPALLDAISRHVAASIGDLGTVSLLSEDGLVLRPMAVTHIDPQVQPQMARLLTAFVRPADAGLTGEVIHQGQPRRVANVALELLGDGDKREYAQNLEQFGFHSMMLAALRAHGQVLGTVGALRDRPGRSYTEDDLTMLQELADRAALAIDNARLYQAAQDAVRIRDQFLSIAAHELKTPLTSLMGQAQLLQRRADREGDMSQRNRRAISTIAHQAARLNTLIGALLDISRIQAGELGLTRAALDLGALARRVVEELQPTLGAHYTVVCVAPDTPLLIDGDALRIEQVLHNLIGNAVKYSPAGGVIRVQVERCEDGACMQVADPGMGIPAGDLPNIFQRFYRAANASATHISGFGIGLSIVEAIVTQHGGYVTVESVEGAGSTFTVHLPATQEATNRPDVIESLRPADG